MPQVAVPSSYFVKARREYTDWIYATWREKFQNSVDAGATQINIGVTKVGAGIEVVFRDNGCGMTRDILVGSFLTLGGSHKQEGSTGGFGYAKTLLLFANVRWSVRTNDLCAEGSHGEYEIHSQPPIIGTELRTYITADGWDSERLYEAFMLNLAKFLANYDVDSQDLDLTVNVNGSDWKIFTNPETPDSWNNCDTPIGPMYFADRPAGQRHTILWVCINAIPMFSINAHADKPLIAYLEIKGKSTDVLTANRDNLKPHVQEQVEKIIVQLTQNAQALRVKPGLDFTINDKVGSTRTTYRVTRHSEAVATAFSDQVAAQRAQMETKLNKWLNRLDHSIYPENWRFMVQGDQETEAYKYAQTQKSARMAYIWKTAVCLVLESLAKYHDGGVFAGRTIREHLDEQGRNWYDGQGYFTIGDDTVQYGFVFRPTCEALYTQQGETAGFLVNPFGMRDDVFNGDWFSGDMLDRAIHEVAHAWEFYHNETFVQRVDAIREVYRRHYFEADVERIGKQLFKANVTHRENA